MIKGSTVIMSSAYIDEIDSYISLLQTKLSKESNERKKSELQSQIDSYTDKLEKALAFQDTIDEVLNIDMPRLTLVKTMRGSVIPIKNVQVL
jgi:DNA-binding transcriptional regulator GbsR (MarR family)